jgi:hypothetical protein
VFFHIFCPECVTFCVACWLPIEIWLSIQLRHSIDHEKHSRLIKMKSTLKKTITCLALAMPLQVHSAVITELTWNDATNGNVTSTDGTGTNISYASTLVSFKVGTDEYSNFVTVNSTNASGADDVTPYWGVNSTDLSAGDDQLSVTDNRLDTGMVNIGDDSDFSFASSPTSLDQVLFIFDVGSADGSLNVELIDGLGGNVVGTTLSVNFSVASVANIDFERVDGGGTSTTGGTDAAFVGLALSFSDFGLTSGDLSSIAGVRLDSGGGLDPGLIGFTAVPEPSSTALLGLGGLSLIMRRRR